MPPFGERKPKLSLTSMLSDEVIAARHLLFTGWIDRCAVYNLQRENQIERALAILSPDK